MRTTPTTITITVPTPVPLRSSTPPTPPMAMLVTARAVATLIVLGLVATGCSGRSASPVAVSAPAAVAPGAALGGGTVPPLVTTTVAATTTTTAAPAVLRAVRASLPDQAGERTTMAIDDVVTGPGDLAGLAVGSRGNAPGEPVRAAVFPLVAGGAPRAVIDLPADGGGASYARALAVHDAVVVVAGSVERADGQRPALWQSDDGGATFASVAHPWADVSGIAVAAAFAGADAVVVAQRADGDGGAGVTLQLARRTDGRWVTSSVPVDGWFAEVTGIAAPTPDEIVVTGSVRRDGQRRAVVWRSGDGGATFTADRLGDRYRAVSAPAGDGGGLVVVATRAADGRLDLVRSTDGVAWEPTALDVARADGSSIALENSEPPNVVVHDGRYVFGAVDVVSVVVVVDADGRGVSDIPIPVSPRPEVFRLAPRVVVAGDRVLVALHGETASKVATGQLRAGRAVAVDWGWADRASAVATSGPTVTDVALSRLAAGPLATVTTYPHVWSAGNGRIEWRPLTLSSSTTDGRSWARLGDDVLPPGADLVFTDGTTDLAVDRAVDDPADAGGTGPLGGTVVRRRDGQGPWSEPALVLSGPGADSARDAARIAVGWLVVGERQQLGAEGSTVVEPVITVGDGTSWTPATIDGVVGQARLTDVVGSPTGPVAVLGTSKVDGDWVPLVLGRRADRTWVPATLPSVARPTLYGGVADATGVRLLAREGDDTVVYRSTDGLVFERVVLSLPNPAAAFPTRLLVAASGLQLLVGTVWRGYAERLAVWTSVDGVTWVPRELSGVTAGQGPGDVSAELTIDDALLAGSELVVAGVFRRQAVVWTVALR